MSVTILPMKKVLVRFQVCEIRKSLIKTIVRFLYQMTNKRCAVMILILLSLCLHTASVVITYYLYCGRTLDTLKSFCVLDNKIIFHSLGLNTNQENQYMKLKKSVIKGDLQLVESIIKSQSNDNKWTINMAAEEGSTLLYLYVQDLAKKCSHNISSFK